jgi:hypothetical protein
MNDSKNANSIINPELGTNLNENLIWKAVHYSENNNDALVVVNEGKATVEILPTAGITEIKSDFVEGGDVL